MGLRVRAVLVVLLLLAITALAIPLALTLADRRTEGLAAERDRQLAALTDAAAAPTAQLQRLVERYRDVYREGLIVIDADGRTLASGGLATTDPEVATAASRALVDAPASRWRAIRPWHERQLLATAAIRRDGELVGAVVLSVDTWAAARDIAISWLWLAVGGLGILAVAVVVARSLTRWVLRPLTGLERAVADMAEGVAGIEPAEVAGPPELRHFTAAFNSMAQAVQASLDRQRRLVADASHQLRNPLAAVRLRADTLETYVADEGRPTYDSLTAQLDRFENLLQQLMRLARAEQVSGRRQAGLTSTAQESTDLDDVVAERQAFWEPVAVRGDQELRSSPTHSGVRVQVARHEVEQLVDVAVDNALRYAGEGAVVTVSAAPGTDTVDLIVSDNGCGLPEEDYTRAAARFWRGRDDATGTGLGLAIAAEIAAGHGGTTSVEKAPEGGLLVRYRLPLAETST
ncbi:MAG: sensor histidine kinase [Mycobacterium sp.]|jgi:signal transduction histidine kinase